MENVLIISLMGGNEIKFSKEEAHGKEPWSLVQRAASCVRSLDSLEGENPSLSPNPKCAKITRKCGTQWASNQCMRNSWYPVGFHPCHCYLLQNLRIETKKTNYWHCPQKVSWGGVVNSFVRYSHQPHCTEVPLISP